MTTTTSKAAALIAESQNENRIASAAYTEELAAELRRLCDDYSEPGAGEVCGDYWGGEGPVSDVDGSQQDGDWRVELVAPRSEDLWCPHCGRADGKHENGYSCSQ